MSPCKGRGGCGCWTPYVQLGGMCVTARRSTCEGTWWQWWQGLKEDLGDHSAGIVDAAWAEAATRVEHDDDGPPGHSDYPL